MLSAADFGAVGDGSTDDTAALHRALTALVPGDTLALTSGATYLHSDVLTVATPDTRVTGRAVLVATDPERSALALRADRIRLDGLTLRVPASDVRREGLDQMTLLLRDHAGIQVSNVSIEGSSAAGVFVTAATNFILSDVRVSGTNADGIHITNGSAAGTLVRPVVRNVGDDGIAVVSYRKDGDGLVHDIDIRSPRFYGNTWGRGFAVVGGRDITWTDVYAERSSSAALYIAAEGSYDSYGSERITVDGGTLVDSNTRAEVDHGAVLVYNDKADAENRDIDIRNVTIRDTRAGASRQVGVISIDGAVQVGVRLSGFTVLGGPDRLLLATGGDEVVRTDAWRYNGKPVTPRG